MCRAMRAVSRDSARAVILVVPPRRPLAALHRRRRKVARDLTTALVPVARPANVPTQPLAERPHDALERVELEQSLDRGQRGLGAGGRAGRSRRRAVRRREADAAIVVAARALDTDRLVIYADRWVDVVTGVIAVGVTAAAGRSLLAGGVAGAVLVLSAVVSSAGTPLAGASAREAGDARARFGRSLVSVLDAVRTVKLAAATAASTATRTAASTTTRAATAARLGGGRPCSGRRVGRRRGSRSGARGASARRGSRRRRGAWAAAGGRRRRRRRWRT